MTRRNLENRLEELEQDHTGDLEDEPTPEPATRWMEEWNIPQELWNDPAKAWVYCLTDGDRYPNLESPGEQ